LVILVNIKLVAKKAKVSTATVSRTLNKDPRVRPETARKVLRVIQKMDYHPNTYARTLHSGRSRTLGLTISDISNPFFPEIVKSFEEFALKNNYEVLLTDTNHDPTRMARCVQRMLERRVEGVAILTSEVDTGLIDQMARRRLPIVFLDLGSVHARISNISVDYKQGIREAAKHLFHLGHRRIGFISGPLELRSVQIRRSAFLECMEEYGVPYDVQLVREGNYRIEGGQLAMSSLLQLQNPLTAVMTSNDLSAIGAMRAIHRKGLRVPEDISVVGFDDIDLSQYTHPPLTTVRLSRSELGETAFNALAHILSGDSNHGQEYRVETHLIVRESTGPVPLASTLEATLLTSE
jgi:DNA-binding LacI/PurR family transcriptional regulator